MDELIGIYKGLRMPALGILLLAITVYVFWPRNKKRLEQAKYDMLNDDFSDESSGEMPAVKTEPLHKES